MDLVPPRLSTVARCLGWHYPFFLLLLKIPLTLIFVLVGLLGFEPLVRGQVSEEYIHSIEVQGNQHIELQAILGELTIKKGDAFSQEHIREQIQRIYSMGFFEDVEIKTEIIPKGVMVVIRVQEKLFTSEVVFDGNEEISDDKLEEKVTVRNQMFLDKEQVKISVENLRKLYQDKGYYHAQLVPIMDILEGNRTRLTFVIEEGNQAHIKTIEFETLSVVEKKELLAGMANREWSWPWSYFSDAGILRREEIPNDVERIKEVYLNKGYLDVQVGTPRIELDETKEWFALLFPVVEGEPYIVSQIVYTGNTIFSDEELQEGLSFESGAVFQRARIREEITRITDLYGSLGYAFTEAQPAVDPDPLSRSTKVTFSIDEGEMVRIRDIKISGNNKTRDNVIRRELRVAERDMIDSPAIKRSFARLKNLNFFETVEILPKQISPGEVDLDVRVKEKPTGAFSIGGGFSTLDQFTLIADITEGNFLGRGYLARIRGQVGGRRTLGTITFRNPRIFDSLTSAQVDIFRSDTDFLTYRQKRMGTNLTFGQGFSEYLSGTISLVAEKITIKDPSSDAPDIILDQQGTQSTTGFRSTLFRDSRDFYIDPRQGSRMGIRTSLGTEYLGGSNSFYSVSFDALKFFPLPFWDFRISTRGRIGYGSAFSGEDYPLSEFFFVGGINTVRGFKFGRAGPVTDSNDPEGGNKQLIWNNDLIFPILPDAKLNGVLFFDYGEGFAEGDNLSLNLRQAAGFEVRWISPFGPLRAAYGYNLKPRSGEKSAVFEFSVGSVF